MVVRSVDLPTTDTTPKMIAPPKHPCVPQETSAPGQILVEHLLFPPVVRLLHIALLV